MKKVLFIALFTFIGSASFYSCTTGHGGGCDAYGGSGSIVVKHVGKSV
jgi:hypothetical protein